MIEQRQATEALQTQTKRLVRLFSAIAIDAVISEDVPVLKTSIEQLLLSEPSLLPAAVFDEDGTALVQSTREAQSALSANSILRTKRLGGLRWSVTQANIGLQLSNASWWRAP